MASQLKIDQVGLPAGVPGFARTDGLDSGATVTLSNTGTGATTRFQLLWVPVGDTHAVASLAPTSNPKVWAFTPTPGVYGSYLLELIENEGLSGHLVERRVFAIRTPRLGLVIPALNESSPPVTLLTADADRVEASNNNASDYPDERLNQLRYAGWWRSLHELVMQVDRGATIIRTDNADVGPAHVIRLVNTSGATWTARLDADANVVDVEVQGVVGATGATGAEGPTGPMGAVGAAGEPGARGAQGEAGQLGPVGATGPTGPMGPMGATGPTGSTGATGPIGSQGTPGATGANGARGPIGARGEVGATGATGPTGAPGVTGSPGPEGAAGAQGTFGGANAGRWLFSNGGGVPGSTRLRVDGVPQNHSSRVHAHYTSADSGGWAALLASWVDSTSTVKGHLRLVHRSNTSKWLVFAITSFVDNVTYGTFNGTTVASSSSSPFAAEDEVVVEFTRTGDHGDAGARASLPAPSWFDDMFLITETTRAVPAPCLCTRQGNWRIDVSGNDWTISSAPDVGCGWTRFEAHTGGSSFSLRSGIKGNVSLGATRDVIGRVRANALKDVAFEFGLFASDENAIAFRFIETDGLHLRATTKTSGMATYDESTGVVVDDGAAYTLRISRSESGDLDFYVNGVRTNTIAEATHGLASELAVLVSVAWRLESTEASFDIDCIGWDGAASRAF